MTTVGQIAAWMDEIAPRRLAEEWDNVGLLMGDRAAKVDRVMTCLTVTPITAAEAIEAGAETIVSHHPILFRPAQTVRTDDPQGKMIWSLAKAGISVLSHHTAFDNAQGGINDLLAARLGLTEVRPLRPSAPPSSFKLVIFTPDEARNDVLSAAFQAGAGQIGDYSECSFSSTGRGTFLGGEATNPSVGERGKRMTVKEWKIEVVSPAARLEAVLRAIRSVHPYEEPAIDVLPLHPSAAGSGSGRLGRLTRPMDLDSFARLVASSLAAPTTQVVGEPNQRIERVAISCGAGDSFLDDASRLADVLLTGEARFHRGLEAVASGIGLVVAGHHATERPAVEDLADRLGRSFPALEVWASRREVDPFRGISS